MISLYGQAGNALYRNPAARRSADAGRDAFNQRFVDGADRERIEASLVANGEASLVTNVGPTAASSHMKWWSALALPRRGHRAASLLVSETDVSSLFEGRVRGLFLAQR